eukprot:CAMPEP_0118979326 /NCGR_PEP_ID=MMETSP1173-20130426/25707_1 /TAXON_ID=1034831 /ORGANISM="Rhizochromulina marina cf, Strain CCMP1243" /LENGTH=78 /DNA_ID=CAMNT_0006929583 /DNA_START=33 /DNA_END=269 /DNA_ORIENTATION=+
MSNDHKLAAYGLYKQVTAGNCDTSRPGFFNQVGRAKWDAWKSREGMSTEDAMRAYVDLAKAIGFEPVVAAAAAGGGEE